MTVDNPILTKAKVERMLVDKLHYETGVPVKTRNISEEKWEFIKKRVVDEIRLTKKLGMV